MGVQVPPGARLATFGRVPGSWHSEPSYNETDFPFRSKAHAVRRSVCLECQRSYWRAYYHRDRLGRGERRRRSNATYRERNRIRVLDYLKTHPCVDCGEKDAVVLEFDHVRGFKLGDGERLNAIGDLMEANFRRDREVRGSMRQLSSPQDG
jgi:hypothetical protein